MGAGLLVPLQWQLARWLEALGRTLREAGRTLIFDPPSHRSLSFLAAPRTWRLPLLAQASVRLNFSTWLLAWPCTSVQLSSTSMSQSWPDPIVASWLKLIRSIRVRDDPDLRSYRDLIGRLRCPKTVQKPGYFSTPSDLVIFSSFFFLFSPKPGPEVFALLPRLNRQVGYNNKKTLQT